MNSNTKEKYNDLKKWKKPYLMVLSKNQTKVGVNQENKETGTYIPTAATS